jgi:Ca-activated chloride channel homolog
MRGLAVACATTLVVGSSAIAARQQMVFRSAVDSVLVDVSVQQRGRPVTDLTAADFDLRDAGVPQHVTDVSREALPVDVTFVVDLSGSVQGPILDALTRAITAASQRLGQADRSEVITFNQRIRQARPMSDGGLPASFRLGTPLQQTSLLDALAIALVEPHDPGRRHLALVFTDGLDTTSFLDGATVVELARRSQMAVFAVALTGGTVRTPQRPEHQALFESLAATSGGTLTVLQRDQDLGDSFTRALDDFRTSYVLRYTYDGPSRPGWHELTVRLTRRGTYDVRARQGYFAAKP